MSPEKSSYYLFLLFLFLTLLLLLVLLLLPLTIRISINNLRKANTVSFELKLFLAGRFKLFVYKKILFTLKIGEEGDVFLSLWRLFAEEKRGWKEPRERTIKKHLLIIHRLISAFGWERMDLYLKLGTGDPSRTGLITGFLRFLSGMLSLYLAKKTGLRQKPGIFVYPSFFKRELLISFCVEFGFNGLRLVYYSMRLFWEITVAGYFKKIWRCVKNGGTSYSGFNDYGDGKLKGDG